VVTKYDHHFGNLTPGFCASLLNAARVQKAMRVLDLATGPGYVAGAAAQHGAEVIGVDFAPNMVAEARTLHPQATFQEADAEAQGATVRWVHGDMCELLFDREFDA
jgi:ubiquinone/menaquinone biosynthesis C-methylase UbiE